MHKEHFQTDPWTITAFQETPDDYSGSAAAAPALDEHFPWYRLRRLPRK